MKVSRNRSLSILAFVAVLVMAMLACNYPSAVGNQTTSNSNGSVEVTSIAPTEIPAIGLSANPTPFSFTLTEGQLNDIVQQSLAQQPNQQVQDVHIRLQTGFMYVSGTVKQNGLTLPLNLKIAVNPDGQGGVVFKVVSGSAGPLPLPQSMRDQIETMLNQKLQPVVSQLTSAMYIDTITIGDGIMNVTGHSR